ncbi:hypothetical protein G6F31_021540 [Rhizopus arrhizus]|nr:hypothetical protein G6F31_021540 [Rhizopus arrhizus]
MKLPLINLVKSRVASQVLPGVRGKVQAVVMLSVVLTKQQEVDAHRKPRSIGNSSDRYTLPVLLTLTCGAVASNCDPSGDRVMVRACSTTGPNIGLAMSSERSAL